MHGQDAGEGAAESQDMGYDDDDDLAALNAAGNSEGLQDALRQERPHWSATSSTSDDEGMEAEPRFYRSSSRASGSSGRMTIPPSEDDDSDDEDPETKAGFSALKAAQRAVPEPDKKEMPKASSSRSLSTPPIAARSKREISRDQERPTWKRGADMEQPTRPSSSTIRARSVHGGRPLQQPVPKRSRPVKLEPQDNFIALSGSSSEIINIDSDSDDDGVQVIEPSDIDVVVRTDGKVGLKQQRPRVEKTVQLAVDFFLSYYLFLAFFPTSEEKTVFTLDALVNAAHTHNFDDIKKRLCPRCLLAPMLHGRVSNFRLKAKTAADAIVVSDYDLKINIEARVMFLLEGMRYIHVLVPGAIDPKTGRPGADVIQKDTAFMAGGIKTTLMNAFFKGSPSLAQKYSNLFETGVNGRKKMPRCMVAAGATAVHTSLNEYRTGYHIKTTFDGNHLHEIYETHLLLIDTLVAANSTLLEDLYTSLTQGSRLAAVAGRPIAKEALALLGL
ncbi:hypothetical protein C8R47DRAFT_335343 [Mycena vitilis]|nr:hypothetical protein C8R47DRAFT_335343 [Mycena vitilis]